MKRTICLSISTFIILVLASTGLMAGGKSFEGIITYKISYPDNKFTESQQAMFPTMLTVSIKGSNSKTEIKTQMGDQIEITDYVAKTKVALIDMMGQKYAVRSTAEEIEKENAKEPPATVEITSETKVIAGYTCKKAIVTVNDDGVVSKYNVYFTNELGPKAANFDNPLYKDIDGVMLEFSMKTPQFTMVFSATSVEKKNLTAKEFEVPSDFTVITKEELKTKFGGMGQ
jgi:GLPGLI family protein